MKRFKRILKHIILALLPIIQINTPVHQLATPRGEVDLVFGRAETDASDAEEGEVFLVGVFALADGLVDYSVIFGFLVGF